MTRFLLTLTVLVVSAAFTNAVILPRASGNPAYAIATSLFFPSDVSDHRALVVTTVPRLINLGLTLETSPTVVVYCSVHTLRSKAKIRTTFSALTTMYARSLFIFVQLMLTSDFDV